MPWAGESSWEGKLVARLMNFKGRAGAPAPFLPWSCSQSAVFFSRRLPQGILVPPGVWLCGWGLGWDGVKVLLWEGARVLP